MDASALDAAAESTVALDIDSVSKAVEDRGGVADAREVVLSTTALVGADEMIEELGRELNIEAEVDDEDSVLVLIGFVVDPVPETAPEVVLELSAAVTDEGELNRGRPQPPVPGTDPGKVKPPADCGGPTMREEQLQI